MVIEVEFIDRMAGKIKTSRLNRSYVYFMDVKAHSMHLESHEWFGFTGRAYCGGSQLGQYPGGKQNTKSARLSKQLFAVSCFVLGAKRRSVPCLRCFACKKADKYVEFNACATVSPHDLAYETELTTFNLKDNDRLHAFVGRYQVLEHSCLCRDSKVAWNLEFEKPIPDILVPFRLLYVRRW